MTKLATKYVTYAAREIGSASEQIVKSFKAAAATNYKDGDAVTIDGNGRVQLNATNDAKIDGFVVSNVDNTHGANDEVTVPVLLKGNIWVDCLIPTGGPVFTIGRSCGMGGGVGGIPSGTIVVATGTAGNNTLTSLSIQATGAAAIIRKGLFYFKGSNRFI